MDLYDVVIEADTEPRSAHGVVIAWVGADRVLVQWGRTEPAEDGFETVEYVDQLKVY